LISQTVTIPDIAKEKTMTKIAIIGVPSSAGARQTGQEKAPQAYRRAGLIEQLRSAGLTATDFGDLPEASFQPDLQHPKAQNLQLVVDVAKRVANQVESAVRDNALPMVLGGDCTIALGVVAGMINHAPNLGLMYFDGDLDLNTPETTPSGIFDGMVMAHMTGKGVDALTRLGPRTPLMAEEDIVMFAFNPEAGAIDAVEMELLPQCRMLKYPVSEIRGKAQESAREALSRLEKRADSILIHFDVDVIDYEDFPVGDLPHYHGLSFVEAMSALEVFVASRKFGGLVITEFNADRDVDGTHARRFVDALSSTLGEKGHQI
jgi:arginase